MNDLCKFLISHIILDFDGEVNQEIITRFLVEDRSPLAQSLKGRLSAEHGPEDFLIVLSDCLRAAIRTGITAEVVEQKIQTYVDS